MQDRREMLAGMEPGRTHPPVAAEKVAEVRLPTVCLVVLVGPSGAGKSAWAAQWFRPGQVVSSDRLRALVGEGEDDQRAGGDAFEVLDLVLDRRLARGLPTVVDTLALDPGRRAGYLALARRHGVACHAVAFDTSAAVCRTRNRARERPLPSKVLTAQLASWATARESLAGEGFDGVHEPGAVAVVPAAMVAAPAFAARQREEPVALTFGLQIGAFDWPGGPAERGERLAAIARAAEEAGFASIWVMDHLVQIPQVGREWDDLLESWTTLGFLAGVTRRVRLGTLVTAITLRNVVHLAKIVATVDVLSGGRAVCGLGAAWFAREHRVAGLVLPPAGERLDLLEDALELLPLLWGPGAPPYRGRRLTVPEALSYPRPLQERVPLLVGGQGERRTLRLVAEHADACNLFGDPGLVAHKLAVLRAHCAAVGRDPAEIEVTHLSTVLVAADRAGVRAAVEAVRPRGVTPEAVVDRLRAGTVEDHVGAFRALAEAGVQTAIVRLGDLADARAVEAFAAVIAAFPPAGDPSG